MDLLAGKKLIRRSGDEVEADIHFKDVRVIGFYFGAYWCGRCKMFAKKLQDIYEDFKELGFEIVFVSGDATKDDQMAYFNEKQGDWLAIHHGSDLIDAAVNKFSVFAIPAFIVVKKDGSTICKDAVEPVQSRGADAVKEWLDTVKGQSLKRESEIVKEKDREVPPASKKEPEASTSSTKEDKKEKTDSVKGPLKEPPSVPSKASISKDDKSKTRSMSVLKKDKASSSIEKGKDTKKDTDQDDSKSSKSKDTSKDSVKEDRKASKGKKNSKK